LLRFYRPHIAGIFVMLLLTFGQAMAELSLPGYMAAIIDSGILAGDTRLILAQGVRMLLMSLLSVACAVGVGFFASRISARASFDIRGAIFRRVTFFANPEFDRFSTASLTTRSTNDVQQIQMVTSMLFRMALFAPIMGIGALIRSYGTSPSLSWTIALALALILVMLLIMFTLMMPRFRLSQKLLDRINLAMSERLSGMLVIRAFRAEGPSEARFDETNSALMKLNLFINRTLSLMMPLMFFIMNAVCILILWAGSRIIGVDGFQVGDMLAFIQYTMHIIMSFIMLSMVFFMLPRAMVSMTRIAEALDAEISIKDAPADRLRHLPDAGAAALEFDRVSFRYPGADEYVIRDISFTARPGETTAFIGGTGSGKSTVMNLIPRFYDVSEGEIRIGGVNIKYLPQRELRDSIGYVPQQPALFSGTIESNLRYGGREASLGELAEAAETAQAAGFIAEKPDGYGESVAQGGTNVSGGQRQRLAIARALVKKAPIYVFDDSFSALDFKTEKALRAALKDRMGGSAVLIVAQRISAIRNADRIIVMDEGLIAGSGTHRELMESCGVYREIALSQLSEEELRR
jgi:ATP-binding cassette subfamily B protein